MLLRKKKNRGFTFLEYATVTICFVVALITMQIYIKRALQGRLKQTADQFGAQYAPRRTTGAYQSTYNSNSVSQTLTMNEIELGYDLDGDGDLESDVTATRNINAVGTYSDTNGDGIIDRDEITGGLVSRRVGGEVVGQINPDENLFDE